MANHPVYDIHTPYMEAYTNITAAIEKAIEVIVEDFPGMDALEIQEQLRHSLQDISKTFSSQNNILLYVIAMRELQS